MASVDPLRVSEDRRTAYATVRYDREAADLDASAREGLEDATAGLDAALSGAVIDGSATGGFPVGELIGLAIAVVLLIAVLRNLRAARRSPLDAARRANATAGHSALVAASIVLVSISGLLVTGIPFVARAGIAAGLVVLACAVTCVVLLPARFAMAGERLLPRGERPAKPSRTPWATRRPWAALVGAGAVTVALAVPAAGLELGQQDEATRRLVERRDARAAVHGAGGARAARRPPVARPSRPAA